MKKPGLTQPHATLPGVPADNTHRRWVQTDRKAHEAMGQLALVNPKAAAVLHRLIALMGNQNAVVISQEVLAKMIGISLRSVARAIAALSANRWIEIVSIGKGTTRAYIVNSRVVWGQSREQLRLSLFEAQVIAEWSEQDLKLLGTGDLRRIPTIFPGEQQLPTGPGEDPPCQPYLTDMEPDLPALTETDFLSQEE